MSTANYLITGLFTLPILMLGIQLMYRHASDWVHLCGSTLFLLLAFFLFMNTPSALILYVGSWKAPFGITLYIDQLSSLMLFVFAIVQACIFIYSLSDKAITQKKPSFYMGAWLLLLGITGAITTFDLFNLYVWTEITLVSAVILLSSNLQKNFRSIKEYVIINIVGTLLVLMAIGFIYGISGQLNYAGIAAYLERHDTYLTVTFLLLLVLGFGFKAAIFPFYFWLPKTYPQTSSSAVMLLSSLSSKVIMVVLIRLAWLWLPLHQAFFIGIFVAIACITMLFGVFGAAKQNRLYNILSFHIISQLGYVLLAIFIPSQLAIVAAIYFLVHNIFIKTNLFLLSGSVDNHYGSNYLSNLGAIISDNKLLAALFFISAMSLAGIPPLSGFWAKLLVFKAAFDNHFYLSLAVALFVSLFTLYSMLKMWRYAFCERNANTQAQRFKLPKPQMLASIILLGSSLAISLSPNYFLNRLANISNSLIQRQEILSNVLGTQNAQ